MHATTAVHPGRAATAWQWRWGRRVLYGVAALVTLIAILIAIAFMIDEPLRRNMEARLNASMKGYTVRLPELDFHPLGFSITLRGLSVSQNAHPKPPVVKIDRLDASVQWQALIHLRLVADFELASPQVYVNRSQLEAEAKDKVPVEQKGWQDALEQIYPLKINEFIITDATITYVEKDPKDALKITDANFWANNIRNVASPDRTYPSPYHLDMVIFGKGKLAVDGDANFLAEPQPASKGTIDLRGVPLLKLKPVSTQANVHVANGILDAKGDFEYSDKYQWVHLQQVTINKLTADYVHRPQTAAAEEQRKDKVEEAAQKTAEHPTAELKIDSFKLQDATLGYVDETTTPTYRVALEDTDAELRGFSNQPEAGPSKFTMTSKFMGSGDTHLDVDFVARKQPDIDLSLRIDGTDMKAMNDLFRAYGNFDVVGGKFSLYTEMHIKNGQVDGYIKPFFTDMDVYDRRQDSSKPILKQVYEAMVGGLNKLLENRREDLATKADIKGSTESPKLSIWQVIVNVIRNGWFKAILPGFEQAVRERRT